jgi:hypothetical protein
MVKRAPGGRSGVLEAVDRILNRGGESREVVHEVVAAVHRVYPYAAVAVDGPDGSIVVAEAGEPQAPGDHVPIVSRGERVGELRVAGAAPDGPFLDRIALLVSAHCRAVGGA